MSLASEPYLHWGSDRVYNPLTDRTLSAGEPAYTRLREGRPCQQLRREGWLGPSDLAQRDRRFYLKYVSLEGNSACNQACDFCPVSLEKRPDQTMTLELYDRIASQLTAFDTLEGVFMNHYNEPTSSRHFLEHVRILKSHALPVALLSNATGLTPARVDALRGLGGLAYVGINLSSLDRQRYQATRGADHLPLVLRNLDYLGQHALAPQMHIDVLGPDLETIQERFRDTAFQVRGFTPTDRSGYLATGLKVPEPLSQLRGCEQMGSRPLQHLHVNASAQALLCCQDYLGHYILGDLSQQTVLEVLTGPQAARLRRWVYGLEEAPADFLCRRCVHAL